jgi:hypothetical protein
VGGGVDVGGPVDGLAATDAGHALDGGDGGLDGA